MARPIAIRAASQYRFHVDQVASATGNHTIRSLSSSPSLECTRRSILVNVPRSRPSEPPPVCTCVHRATCCMCVCDLGVCNGNRTRRGASPDPLVDDGVIAPEVCGHRVPLSDLAHVANRGGGPSQQSCHNPVRKRFLDDTRVRDTNNRPSDGRFGDQGPFRGLQLMDSKRRQPWPC